MPFDKADLLARNPGPIAARPADPDGVVLLGISISNKLDS
jgi:hypothetical protein